MGDVNTLDAVGVINADEHSTGHRSLGIVLAGENNGDNSFVGELGTGTSSESSFSRSQHELRQGSLQTGKNNLSLRVSKASIELNDADALGGQNQAAIEQTLEGGAFCFELAHSRESNSFDDLGHECLFAAELISKPGQW